ncbi:hypothetical protein CGGC5_v004510 [Colletotrichum fructicola Nara gc5]|uniref:Uncharacterized protein n=1 Tax=Colletotrichum fructicola (strain Nara gc5) TaxID=1213859 RepID=A0A7J6JIE8_COLFN|nr:hypothetical protein CGGC5_v004510 [Colletotrichum fructicola Nara gc5]
MPCDDVCESDGVRSLCPDLRRRLLDSTIPSILNKHQKCRSGQRLLHQGSRLSVKVSLLIMMQNKKVK